MKIIKVSSTASAMVSFVLLVRCFVNNNSFSILNGSESDYLLLLAFGVFVVLLGLILAPIIIKSAKLAKATAPDFSKIVYVGLVAVVLAVLEIVLFALVSENGVLTFSLNSLNANLNEAVFLANNYRILRENFIFINIISVIDGIITIAAALYYKKTKSE